MSCACNEYNPADYKVDLSTLKKERPIGVSGLMRVKNEEQWVAAAIDSCIDALDELIICYMECSDQTPAILRQKQKEYPDKIKVYYYAPHIYTSNLSNDDFELACNLPDDSIHLLSNYYNYTLSKSTYRYALKIDADQVYFTELLTVICDAYRGRRIQKFKLLSKVVYYYLKCYSYINSRYLKIGAFLSRFAPLGLHVYKMYFNYCLNEIAVDKQVEISLSGVNLYAKENKWNLFFMERSDSIRPVFYNGVGDHLVFEVSDQTYYIPVFQSPYEEYISDKIQRNSFFKDRRIIERFVSPPQRRCLHIGFIWFHMKFAFAKEIEGDRVRSFCSFPDFVKIKYISLFKKKIWVCNNIYTILFHESIKKLPDPSFLLSRFHLYPRDNY